MKRPVAHKAKGRCHQGEGLAAGRLLACDLQMGLAGFLDELDEGKDGFAHGGLLSEMLIRCCGTHLKRRMTQG